MSEEPTDKLAELRSRSLLLATEAEEEGRHNREQGSILLRWAITTCMTINAGALVATLNVEKFNQSSQLWAGVWFLIGTVLSLLMAGLLASVFIKTGREYSRTAFQLKRAAEANDFKAFSDLSGAKLTEQGTKGGCAIFTLFLAIISFVVGCGILIEGAP